MEQLEAAVHVQKELDNPPVPTPPPPLYTNAPAPPPAPALDPDNNQLASALSLLMARMDNMEAKLEAKQSAKFEAVEVFLQAQCQEMAAIREFQLTQPSISIPSPSRKKTRQNMNSPSSSRPDDTPDQGVSQDDDLENDSF
jgi:hypothetical protein